MLSRTTISVFRNSFDTFNSGLYLQSGHKSLQYTALLYLLIVFPYIPLTMLFKLSTFAACLSVATAVPYAPARHLVERQIQDKYADNGTLVAPPPKTNLTRANPTYTQEQRNNVKLASTTIERYALLKSYGKMDDYFKFDLTPDGSQSNAANGLGGQGYLAEVGGFPVLTGTGISLAIGYLNPCGLDSIHVHNRADELVVLVAGNSLKTGFVLEDGFGKFISPFPSYLLHTSSSIPSINKH